MDRTGERIDGRYDILRELGRGGICTVYEAEHVYTRRRVALKVLNEAYVHHAEARTRLLREAIALGSLRHPNVVDILDAGIVNDQPYVVTEKLDGRTLDGLLAARQRFAVGDAVAIAIQLARGLSAVHLAGVVHRDVKPSNVLLLRSQTGGEIARLLDFGVARIPTLPTDPKVTGMDSLVGTSEYMAPEQLMGTLDVDARTDVYALGVTLFECLTGTVPRQGSFQEVLMSLATVPEAPSARARRPEVPYLLDGVIARCLARDPATRFASAEDLAQALLSTGTATGETKLLDAVTPVEASNRPAKRASPRAPYVTPVRMVTHDGTADGRTEDIAFGGLLVLTSGHVETGERVHVRFALPATGAMTHCRAIVRWTKAPAARGPMALGLEFIDLGADARAEIATYVALMAAP